MTTINNRQTGEGFVRPEKEQGRSGGDRATPNHSTNFNSTSPEPVAGWHALAKPARMNRHQKRIWRRRCCGAIRGDLAALLILAAVSGLLLAGVWL